VTSLPFLVLGPGAFVRDVVLTVWERSASGALAGTGRPCARPDRPRLPLGLHISPHGAVGIALVTAAVLGLMFVVAALTARAHASTGSPSPAWPPSPS